jgi:hypothetical protein
MTSVIDPARSLELDSTAWTVRRIANYFEIPNERDGTGNDGRLYVPPPQRIWSWTGAKGIKRQREFVDSLIHNYPVPTLILNHIEEGQRDRWQIYDGRHRIQTIKLFYTGQFGIGAAAVKYADLSPADRDRLDNRLVPVVITENASPAQLVDIFIRLNMGKKLSDGDLCWAQKDTPLVGEVIRLILATGPRLSPLLGGIPMERASDIRKDIAHWVGLVLGLSEWNGGLMTTSHFRLSAHMDHTVNEVRVAHGIDALIALLTTANELSPVAKQSDLRAYRKLGFVTAFFLADWMAASDKPTCLTKWVSVIQHIRAHPCSNLLKVAGAQNLDDRKLTIILNRVNRWSNGEDVSDAGSTVADDDEEEE